MGGIIDEVKKTSAVLAGLASVTLLAACSKQNDSQNKTKQVLNWTESTTITTQDPSLATDTTSFNTLLNTQEGLYRYIQPSSIIWIPKST